MAPNSWSLHLVYMAQLTPQLSILRVTRWLGFSSMKTVTNQIGVSSYQFISFCQQV